MQVWHLPGHSQAGDLRHHVCRRRARSPPPPPPLASSSCRAGQHCSRAGLPAQPSTMRASLLAALAVSVTGRCQAATASTLVASCVALPLMTRHYNAQTVPTASFPPSLHHRGLLHSPFRVALAHRAHARMRADICAHAHTRTDPTPACPPPCSGGLLQVLRGRRVAPSLGPGPALHRHRAAAADQHCAIAAASLQVHARACRGTDACARVRACGCACACARHARRGVSQACECMHASSQVPRRRMCTAYVLQQCEAAGGGAGVSGEAGDIPVLFCGRPGWQYSTVLYCTARPRKLPCCASRQYTPIPAHNAAHTRRWARSSPAGRTRATPGGTRGGAPSAPSPPSPATLRARWMPGTWGGVERGVP